MFRSVCSLLLTTFAHEGRLWGGTWVSGNKNLRRIFIFIFYWILIYHIKAGGREREIHYLTFFLALIILSQGRGKGDTLVQNFFSPILWLRKEGGRKIH